MQLFFDTSAVVPLVRSEIHSEVARRAWESMTVAWAWDWMRVEGEAALSRRDAPATCWSGWRAALGGFRLLGLPSALQPELCAFNRGLGLRAADAGHLFVFDRLLTSVPDVRLLTFDEEMRAAAERLGLPLVS